MRHTRMIRSRSRSCLLFFLLLLLAQRLPALSDDRPWIGLDIVDCRTESHSIGVAVLRVEDDSPAQHVGIVAGDIVVAMEDLALTGANDFICRVIGLSPGQRVHLTVLRDGALLSRIVTLGMWPLNVRQASHSCPMQVSLGGSLSFS